MRRGDLVTHSGPGDYSTKPRPALVVQTDRLLITDSVLLCLLTSEEDEPNGLSRIVVEPTSDNGLRRRSHIMVEKLISARRSKCGKVIGRLDKEVLEEVNAALALVLGLLD